ncbi:MAG TPA: hypothetical protein PLY64_10945, partial [Dokdonella sp.]|nr:hypothetical protein [Dokdonella sp.]
ARFLMGMLPVYRANSLSNSSVPARGQTQATPARSPAHLPQVPHKQLIMFNKTLEAKVIAGT